MLRTLRLVGAALAGFGLIATGTAYGCASQVTEADAAVGADAVQVPVPDRTPYEAGWRWESSLGIEVAVPNEWTVNDSDCGQTSAPSIVRAQGFRAACLTPEPPDKQIVEISPPLRPIDSDRAPPAELSREQVTIDGEPAERIEDSLPDGRALGWLTFARTNDFVRARVHDHDFLQRIFDSVRIVAVDAHGCATARTSMTLKAPRENSLVPPDATEVSVCYYDQFQVLQTSALFEGANAAQLIGLLNGAQPGLSPDAPGCADSRSLLADTVIIARGEADAAMVELRFSGCARRGLTNGKTSSRLTLAMLEAIMRPLHTGYSYVPQGLE